MGGETLIISLVLLVISASPATFAALTPSETFSGSATLVKDDVYHLFWKSDSTSITFEVHAKVKGWVGFGLSPNGDMAYSDIVIGWVKDGVSYFTDRWATGMTMPTIDDSQDWVLLAGRETDTHTILKFKRPLYSCDPQDRNVTEDTLRVIFAYSDTDPSSETSVAYHGASRGIKSISFVAQRAEAQDLPDDAFYYNVVNENVTIPHTSDTTYWCSGHYPPTLTGRNHLIRASPVVKPGNAYVHHMLLYACYHVPAQKDNTPSGTVCGTGNMPWNECKTLITGWAIGGQDFVFPEHVGFSFGDSEEGILYLELEIHYDNPSLERDVVDTSGMRLWFSPTLRPNDAGVLIAGVPVDPNLQILPAGYPDLLSVGHCSKECLSQGMGTQSEIKIFANILHTHLLGIGVRVRHFRDGVELPYIDSDAHYDFNYQETRYRNPEITVKKGDSITVECTYNTEDKDVATFGGLGTRNEMCLSFIYYYPRIKLSWCASGPTQKQMASHLSLNYRLNKRGTAILTEGPYANASFTDYIKAIARFPDESLMKKYQEAIITGETIQLCRSGSKVDDPFYPADLTLLETPQVISPYTPVSEPCGSVGNNTGGSNQPPPAAGASSIASLGVLSLLLIYLLSPRVCS